MGPGVVGVSTPLGWVGTSECDLHGRAGSAWPWSPGDRAGSGRAGSVNRLSGDLAPRLAAAGEGRVLRASGGLPAAPRGLELPFLSFQKTDGALTACHHWLPKIFAQANCTARPRLSRQTRPGPWAARPAAPCSVACPQGAPRPCSRPPRATRTRPSSLWTPRPRRYVLSCVTQPWVWGPCLHPVTSNKNVCILSAIRKTSSFTYILKKEMNSETQV